MSETRLDLEKSRLDVAFFSGPYHHPISMQVPPEIQHHLLIFVPPLEAWRLSKTCHDWRERVDTFYRQEYPRLLRGDWRRHLSKRAVDSLAHQAPCPTPLAAHTLIRKSCVFCHQPYRGALNRFGMVAHSPCIRPYLINTYYLETSFGLSDAECVTVPSELLKGYTRYRGEYTYWAVWKCPTGHVPREWTAYHLVHDVFVDVVARANEKRRQAEEAKREERRAKAREQYAMDKPLRQALKDRLDHLKPHVDPDTWSRVVTSGWAKNKCPDFFSASTTCKTSPGEALASIYDISIILQRGEEVAKLLESHKTPRQCYEWIQEYDRCIDTLRQQVGDEEWSFFRETDTAKKLMPWLSNFSSRHDFERAPTLLRGAMEARHAGLNVKDTIHCAQAGRTPARHIRMEVEYIMESMLSRMTSKPGQECLRCTSLYALECTQRRCGRCCDDPHCHRHRMKRRQVYSDVRQSKRSKV